MLHTYIHTDIHTHGILSCVRNPISSKLGLEGQILPLHHSRSSCRLEGPPTRSGQVRLGYAIVKKSLFSEG